MHEDIELNATGRVAYINAELEADAYFPRIRSGAITGWKLYARRANGRLMEGERKHLYGRKSKKMYTKAKLIYSTGIAMPSKRGLRLGAAAVKPPARWSQPRLECIWANSLSAVVNLPLLSCHAQ